MPGACFARMPPEGGDDADPFLGVSLLGHANTRQYAHGCSVSPCAVVPRTSVASVRGQTKIRWRISTQDDVAGITCTRALVHRLPRAHDRSEQHERRLFRKPCVCARAL